MASGGPEEGEVVAGEEQALRKLVVRLQNVQERKRLETLVQTLSDLLELAARQSGERPALPCLALSRAPPVANAVSLFLSPHSSPALQRQKRPRAPAAGGGSVPGSGGRAAGQGPGGSGAGAAAPLRLRSAG